MVPIPIGPPSKKPTKRAPPSIKVVATLTDNPNLLWIANIKVSIGPAPKLVGQGDRSSPCPYNKSNFSQKMDKAFLCSMIIDAFPLEPDLSSASVSTFKSPSTINKVSPLSPSTTGS